MIDEYQMCTFCVMDTTDRDIVFDSEGVCSHCREAKVKLSTDRSFNEKGRNLLLSTASEIRASSRYGKNDCIIGVSGGIDSSFLLHIAVVEMRLNPLVVHIDAGWNSDEAVNNIRSMVEKLNLNFLTFTVDWDEMRDLQVAYLKSSLANQDVPQDHSFFAKLYDIAVENRIKYILTGSNLTSESILPESWGYDAMDGIQLKAIHKKFGSGKLKRYPVCGFLKNKIYYPYFYRMQIVEPLKWVDYNKNEAMAFLKENYGWTYYGAKHHESNWTKFFQAYYLPTKFGFDKRKAHLSSMIVSGQITREDALAELALPLYDKNKIAEEKKRVSSKLGLTVEQLENYLALPNKDFSEFPNQLRYLRFFRFLKSLLLKIGLLR